MVPVHDTFTFGTCQTVPFHGDVKRINIHSSFMSKDGTLFGNSSRNEGVLGSEQPQGLPLGPPDLLSVMVLSLIPTEIRKPIYITESLSVLLSQQRIATTKHLKDFNIFPYHRALKTPSYKLASGKIPFIIRHFVSSLRTYR